MGSEAKAKNQVEKRIILGTIKGDGADGYAPDVASATDLCKALMGV